MAALYHLGKKIQNEVALIIFDKDGTLIDIHHYWASLIKLRAEEICRLKGSPESSHTLYGALVEAMGVNLETSRMKPEGPVGIKPRAFIVNTVVTTLLEAGINMSSVEVEAVFAEIDSRTVKDLKPYLTLLPGVRDFLESCLGASVKTAIATTDLSARARAALDALGISHYFSEVVGADQVKASKPSPDAGMEVLQRLGISAGSSVMVGDHLVDIEMGENCQMGTNVAVLTGLGNRQDFETHRCLVVRSLEELRIQ